MAKASKDPFIPRHADVGNAERRAPYFDQLTRIEAHDREMHIQKGIEAGLTREQAERHADEEMKHWSPRHVEDAAREE
jgi:hypothetical protein